LGDGAGGQILFWLDAEGEVLTMERPSLNGLSKTVGYRQHFSSKIVGYRQHFSSKSVGYRQHFVEKKFIFYEKWLFLFQ
jgi:hypothetical protein